MTGYEESSQVILGIDPGTRITGYGIIRKLGKHAYKPLDFGCIKPPVSLTFPERYLIIFNSIETLIQKHQPQAIAVETQYVHKNVQSAMKLGMARGVVMLAAARHKVPLYEYAPSKAKLAVAGTGRASKHQVGEMVRRMLNLAHLPEPEDAADALALAICHAHQPIFSF